MSREPEPASLALNHSSSTDQQDYQLGHLGQDARLSCKMQDYLTSLASIPHLDNRHDTVYQPHRIVMRRLKITVAAALLRKSRKENWNFHSVDHPQESTGQITNCWASPASPSPGNSGYHLTQGLLWVSWTQFSRSKLRKVSEKMKKSL